MYFVYILYCNDNSLYTGITNNPKKRLKLHNLGKASKYTRVRLPVIYVYMKEIGSRNEALKEEIRIKKLSRSKKIELIKNHTINKEVNVSA